MTEPDGTAIPESIHEAAENWLSRLAGHVDPATERAFAAWIEADPRHRLAYDRIKRDWQLSTLLRERDVGQGRSLGRAPFWMRHKTHVAAATLGAAALLGVVTVGLIRPGGPWGISTPAQAATYETAIGEIRVIRLADGSSITLDTATRLRARMSAGERRLDLEQGRARFHVAPDSRRSFRVVVAGGEVVARSTLFDVSLTGEHPMVTALEGMVEVHGSKAGAGQASVLAVGRSQLLDGNAPQQAASPSEARWVSGMLALDATPLAQAVAAINRYNKVQLRLAEPFPAQIRVTGAFRVREPDAFARAMSKSFRLTIERPDDATLLLIAPASRANAPR